MYSEKELKNLIDLSKKGAEQIKIELDKFEITMKILLEKAPVKDIETIEKVKILTNKSIFLHKEGKVDEGNKVIEELKKLI